MPELEINSISNQLYSYMVFLPVLQLIRRSTQPNRPFASKVTDFSQALASLHDRFGHELQMLVETFRKRNGELRKER